MLIAIRSAIRTAIRTAYCFLQGGNDQSSTDPNEKSNVVAQACFLQGGNDQSSTDPNEKSNVSGSSSLGVVKDTNITSVHCYNRD